MTFFESLLALLLVAIILLQVASRLSLPYPGMLVLAGVGLAMLPGSPVIHLEPRTALALFLAPVVLDAAFDFPIHTARRYWSPLVAFALVAVLITTALVAWIGWSMAGLPWAAAVALGAIVAPPDAAAATATLGRVSLPRSTDAVLRGESLFNDATSLLIFGTALSVLSAGGFQPSVGIRLAFSIPGSLIFGIACAFLFRSLNQFVQGTLRGNLTQFVAAYLVWIVADRLGLSAVLSEVAFAMTLAKSTALTRSARNRVHSYAVWATVVFLLNVFAFLLMGMQAKLIITRMPVARFHDALKFSGTVVLAIVVLRLLMIIGYNRFMAWLLTRRGSKPPANLQQAIFVGWCGMRGLVTLAASFALPESFPQRDLAVLTAFTVVLGTLVIQGLTLLPLIRLLGLDQREAAKREQLEANVALIDAGLGALQGAVGREAEYVRFGYGLRRDAIHLPATGSSFELKRTLSLAALDAEREQLQTLRLENRIGTGNYDALMEELDWRELTLLPESDRRIEEG